MAKCGLNITSIVLFLKIICVMTLYSKAPIGYPTGLRIVSINRTSVTFAWNKPRFRNHITGYYYKFNWGWKRKRGTNEGLDNVVVTFNNLPGRRGKRYTCGLRVAFMNPSGLGPFSPKVYASCTFPTTNNQSRSKRIPISKLSFSNL